MSEETEKAEALEAWFQFSRTFSYAGPIDIDPRAAFMAGRASRAEHDREVAARAKAEALKAAEKALQEAEASGFIGSVNASRAIDAIRAAVLREGQA